MVVRWEGTVWFWSQQRIHQFGAGWIITEGSEGRLPAAWANVVVVVPDLACDPASSRQDKHKHGVGTWDLGLGIGTWKRGISQCEMWRDRMDPFEPQALTATAWALPFPSHIQFSGPTTVCLANRIGVL